MDATTNHDHQYHYHIPGASLMKRNRIGTLAAALAILGIVSLLPPFLVAQEVEFKLSGNTTNQGFSFKNAAGDNLLNLEGNGRVTGGILGLSTNHFNIQENGLYDFLRLEGSANTTLDITNTNQSGDNQAKYGVRAVVRDVHATAISGESIATTGYVDGVWGTVLSPDGVGVRGWARSTTGYAFGVFGQSDALNGCGVKGSASSTTGATVGVYGSAVSPDGWAGYFNGRGHFSGNLGIGTSRPSTPLQVISAEDEVISWGDATGTSKLKSDQGGSIELGNSLGSGTSPYIDFHHGVAAAEDFNFRVQNSGNHILQFFPNSAVPPFVTIAQAAVGIGTVTPQRSLHLASPTTSCEFIMEVQNGQADNRKWDFCVDGGAGNAQNLTFRVLNDAATAATKNVLTLLASGSVGINVTMPAWTLQVEGTAGKTGGGLWSNASDIRLKDVEGDYVRGLADIIRLRPIRFHYRADNPRGLPGGSPEIGFSAQEVREVFPECVSEGRDGYLDFNMHAINVAMVNAVRDLSRQLDAERARSAGLEGGLAALRQELAAIKAQLAGRTETPDATRAELLPQEPSSGGRP